MAEDNVVEIKERVNPIVLRFDDRNETYTLEFDRDAIRFAEGRGFDIDDVGKQPMTKLPELFWYAFRMHHKSVSKEKAERILFDDLGGMPKGMAERLGELYAQPHRALQNETDKPKNPNLTVEM